MLMHMATVKWDIKDIMSQHSQYVDSLLKVSNCSTWLFIIITIICIVLQEFADFADQISKIEKYATTQLVCTSNIK